MDPALAKYEQVCPDCGGTDLVDDHSQGDLICRNCGLVLEAHAIDERSEWRTFSDKDKETVDPNRVGGPTNHLLTDGGLSTVIGASTKGTDGGLANNLQRLSARAGNPDRALLAAFGKIGAICNQLKLVAVIKDRAQELYRDISTSKAIKGKGNAAMCAAVVYIACRQENNPRTFKEICTVVPDATKKDIGRCYKFIVKELEQKMGTIHAKDYINRFGSKLGMNFSDRKVAKEIAERACPLEDSQAARGPQPWDGKNPLSIAAAIIQIVALLPKASCSPVIADIAEVTGVAEVTIRSTYRDLYAHAADLVPGWFATPQDLHRLPDPHVVGVKVA